MNGLDDRRVEAEHIARDLIASGSIDEPDASAARLEPMRIRAPDGSTAGWFVGLVAADRLLGFVQLDEQLRYRRYSSFRGHEPAATDWLDADTVRERAQAFSSAEDELDDPYFGFDVSPDRLAWVVPAKRPDGSRRRLLVAGETVFERPG